MAKKNNGAPKQTFGELVETGVTKLKGLASFVRKHWNSPPAGKSLSFKEMAAYCVGGMGVSAASILPSYLTAAMGVYVAAALNFTAKTVAVVGIISAIITVVKSPFMGMLIDNTKSKYGKFRPYLIWMPIPAMICFVLIGWVPYLLMSVNYIAMVVVFTVLFNLLMVFMQLYQMAFSSLIQVISPSPEERTGLLSVGSVVYSLGPSIIGIFFPLLAGIYSITDPVSGKVTSSGVNMLPTFQWIIPVLALVFFAIGYWTAFGTKERVVVSKKFVQKVKFWDGIKKTLKNRYFWLTTASTTLGIFRILCTSFTIQICVYMIQKDWAQSIANTILGMAYVPGMLLAPMLIKKFGKRNLVIVSNFLLAGISLLMMLLVNVPIVLLVCTLFAIMSNSIQVVTAPAMVAQYYDFQQYKTGDRLEGFLSQFAGMIGGFFGIFTAMVAPAINQLYGYTDDKNVLYEPGVLPNILRLSYFIGALSAVLGALPYFFWNLTEKRHRQIMDILAIRAKAEDGEIEAEVATQLEQDIEEGVPDVIKNYFNKTEEEFLSEEVNSENTTVDAEKLAVDTEKIVIGTKNQADEIDTDDLTF